MCIHSLVVKNDSNIRVLNFIYVIKQDEERLRKVLRFANACGAITTTKKGAIPALPTDAEVLSFLEGK